MTFDEGLLEHTLVYRLWQRPFAERKFRPAELAEDRFDSVIFEPCRLGLGSFTLWNMVYFKGRSRTVRA
ncbi:MAG: hypothetical protein ACYC6F_09775 [Longimicrobiales bacterium]